MWCIFILIFTPACYSQVLFPTEAYYLAFGDLTDINKTFLPFGEQNLKNYDPSVHGDTNMTLKDVLSESYMLESIDQIIESFNSSRRMTGGAKPHYETLLDQIDSQVYNLTANSGFRNTRKRMKETSWDYSWYRGDHFDKFHLSPQRELRKLNKMVMIGMQYLVHARHKVDGAMKQRQSIRNDKRFQIGYLFCRVRRLKTEMIKMLKSVYDQTAVDLSRRISAIIRVYEEIIRMEVDVRDTMWHIKVLYDRIEEYDLADSRSKDNIPGISSGGSTMKPPEGGPADRPGGPPRGPPSDYQG